MKRLFVIRDEAVLANLVSALGANWKAAVDAGTPLGCHVAPYRKTRSQEANALMWVWLGQLAADAWVAGRQYSAETWHEHAKRENLPETNQRGDHKWEEMPDGSRRCVMSTTRLTDREMSDYMDKLGVLAASVGVALR